MPRRSKGPRLYLDRKRGQWIIRDGSNYRRTGCLAGDVEGAEKALRLYLGEKHRPTPSEQPLIADVLLAYAQEHAAHTRTARKISYQIGVLEEWWGDKRLADITPRACRDYAQEHTPSAARRDLETLQAALNWWHRNHHPIVVPSLIFPPKQPARNRWLTRNEVARLLWAARRTRHLYRFILLSIYTGSRSSVVWNLTWGQIDLDRKVMRRLVAGEVEDPRKRKPPVRLGRRILSHLRRWDRLYGRQIPFLCHYDGVPIREAYKSWDKARIKAGLDDTVIPHTLRHTRATWLMQAGVPIWEAAGSLGMTPAVLQSTYGHHHPDWQKLAAEV